MPTDIETQLRQLGTHFRAQVTHVHPDEILDHPDEVLDDPLDEVLGRIDATPAPNAAVHRRARASDRKRQRAAPRLGAAAAVVVLVAGLVVALVWIDRDGSAPVTSPTPTATDPPVSEVQFGQFVWPAPPRGYSNPNELIIAFTSDVLGWTAFDVDGDVDGRSEPQSFTLYNSTLDASVPAIAVPSPDGWGFVQIGTPNLNASIGSGELVLTFPTSPAVTTSSVTVRLSDGTSIDTTVSSSRVELNDTEIQQLVSALVIGRDTDGNAITAVGGQFNPDPPEPAAAPQSTGPSTTSVPSTTTLPAVAPLSCAATTSVDAFMTEFTDQMVLARDSDRLDLIDDCVDTVPAIYDGTAPNCWTACPPASRTFHLDHATNDQLINFEGDLWWHARLPVTYVTDTGIIDVTEYWSIRQTNDRFSIHEFHIETPIVQRQAATDILTDYLAHIDNENWAQAANLLTRAASAPFEDRLDLQHLGADSYDQDNIADALARWCADTCDTTAPSPAELTFTGGYELTRNAQTIRVTWYEGTYGIYGPPLR